MAQWRVVLIGNRPPSLQAVYFMFTCPYHHDETVDEVAARARAMAEAYGLRPTTFLHEKVELLAEES